MILRDVETSPYAKVHFFGTTTDGGPAGGDFVLHYTDGTTDTRTVRFRDWCNAGTATPDHHIAIGPLTHRWTESSQDGAPCGIYHVPATADPAKTLESVTLPSTTTPGSDPIQGYLMALTLEKADGTFVTPDLGATAFPDDLAAPTSQHELDPADAQGDNGWYKTGVEVSLTAADEDGGSGLDAIQYRIDGGEYQDYDAPFTVSDEGNHLVEYRARDKAGNTEAPQPVPVQDRRDAAGHERAGQSRAAGSVRLVRRRGDRDLARQRRRRRLGHPHHRVPDRRRRLAGVQRAVRAEQRRHVRDRVPLDRRGGQRRDRGSADHRAGGRQRTGHPGQRSSAPAGSARVTLTATDGGSGAAMTEYRLDGGAFQPYAGPLTVAALGSHLLEFRSRDRAGNLENLEELAFAVGSPQSSAPPAFVALTPLAKRLAIGSLAHGVRVRATCVSVGRGTLALTVSRATARKLGVGRTLAPALGELRQ